MLKYSSRIAYSYASEFIRGYKTASSFSPFNGRRHKMTPSGQGLTDRDYPGTAVERLQNIIKRVKSLTKEDLSKDWEIVRQKLLWAGGLKDLKDAQPGLGYTGHSFNDFNHCDLTAMKLEVRHNNNEGRVTGIAYNNPLGEGIKIASLQEVGTGGSWTTCMQGCNQEPPQDVAHIQFRSRIAFKLVWVPPKFESFVLVDDSGTLLARGNPIGVLPSLWDRQTNFRLVEGSKYSKVAVEISRKECSEH